MCKIQYQNHGEKKNGNEKKMKSVQTKNQKLETVKYPKVT